MTHKRDVTAQEDAALNAALRSSTVKVEHPEIASLRAELDACETELRIARTSQAESNAEVERLRAELETERMSLVACSVIALANTPESAASARGIHPDYRSASCDDVARAVDREIALRAENEALNAVYKAAKRCVANPAWAGICDEDVELELAVAALAAKGDE